MAEVAIVRLPSHGANQLKRRREIADNHGRHLMADDVKSDARRYVRALGPFNGYHLGLSKAPVLVFNLNVGGGFVTFTEGQPAAATFVLTIDLQQEGRITAKADTVYRDPSGVAVRFVGLDADSSDRLARAVERVRKEQASDPLISAHTRHHDPKSST